MRTDIERGKQMRKATDRETDRQREKNKHKDAG